MLLFHSWRQSYSLPCLLIVSFVLWATLGQPWLAVYEINPDEGFNLGKAALVESGYSLFHEVWSDQPPLLTYALAWVHQWFPWSVTAARLFILASACLLLGSLYALINRKHGRAAAAVALLLLMTAPLFVRLSMSVMVGLPAIALAVLAMVVATSRRWATWHAGAVLAGVIFALSLQTKFFTVLLGPGLLAMVWLNSASAGRRHQIQAAAAFSTACCASFLIVALLAGDAFIEQLLRPHFAEKVRNTYSLEQSAQDIWRVLRRQPVLLLSAIIGIVVLRARLLRDLLPVTLWLVIATGALLLHNPVWYHQPMLLLPGLAWLGGLGLTLVVTNVWWHRGAAARKTVVAASLCLFTLSLWHASTSQRPKPDLHKMAMGELVHRFAPLAGWVLTDSPLDAHRAGLLTPPQLVVYSYKRLLAGALQPSEILLALQTLRPHQAAFRRFPIDADVKQYLEQHYVRTAAWGDAAHYVLRGDQFPSTVSQDEVRRLLASVSKDFAATGVKGGYASAVATHAPQRFGEDVSKPMQPRTVWMRPPGSTPRIGACFLRSHQLTQEPQYLEWASSVAQAVARTQQCAGGWASEASDRQPCTGSGNLGPSRPQLDEGMTAEAINFLLAFKAQSPADAAWVDETVIKALDFLTATQTPQGAWPYSFATETPYASLSTLNDDITTSHVRALIRGHQLYGRAAYGQAVRRGIDFLLQVQSPEGGWAQQYDERGHPAPGRSFEPAALATIESAYVLRTLIEIDQIRPDERVKKAIARGARWLDQVAIGPNRWARFHDQANGRPIYQDREGRRHARWADLPVERRNGYRWEGAFPEVAAAIELATAHLTGDPLQFSATAERISQIKQAVARGDAIKALQPHLEAGRVPLVGAKGLLWSKDFVENCKHLHALWPASTGASSGKKSVIGNQANAPSATDPLF